MKNILTFIRTKKGGNMLKVGSICLVVVIIAGYFILSFVQNIIDSRQEEALFAKYSKDPQWKQVVDMMVTDKKDLATPGITKAKQIGATMDMGLQWFNLREFKFAAKWWEKGLGVEPNNFIGWYNLGNAYKELGKYPKAKSAYGRAMGMAREGETDACLALGEMYKYSYTSKKDKEGDVYLECLKKHKDDRDIVARLAMYYRDAGDVKNALVYFEKLFSIDPSSSVETGEEIRKLQSQQTIEQRRDQ